MVNFVKLLAHEKNISVNNIYSNSVQLSDGVIVKINDNYYRVSLSTDQNTYRLDQTWLTNPAINIIKK